MRHHLLLALGLCTAGASAQDIPDTRLRAMINDQWPGLVDASGNFDGFAWMAILQSGSTGLMLDASPYLQPGEELDMTGLQFLGGISGLTLKGPGAGLNTYYIPAFPELYGGDVGFAYWGIHPDDTYGQPVMVPTFPTTLQRYFLIEAGSLGPGLYIPPGISYFTVEDCTQMDAATWQMPTYLTGLEVRDTPILSLPDVTGVHQLLWLTNCGLTASPPIYYDALLEIDLSGNPITNWSPWPADLHTLKLNGCGLTDLPPGIPDTLTGLWINDNPMSAQIDLPAELMGLRAANCGWDLLPPLPPTLRYLYVQDNALIALPDDLPNLDVMDLSGNAPLTCLADYPTSLEQTMLDGTAVTCLPHPPNFTADVSPDWLATSICGVADPCPSQMPRIRGTAFRDDDADGVRDAGEPGLPYCSVLATPGGWMIGVDDQGRFEAQVPYGVYTITGQPRIYHTITTTAQTAAIGLPMQIDSLNDVGYAPTPGITDLIASMTASVVRPGFGSSITITVTNMGTTDATTDVQLLVDAMHTWTSSSVVPTVLNGNAATWNVTIAAGTSWQCVVIVHTPQSILLGTPLMHTLSATPGAADATPLDNVAVWNAVAVGSSDPNDKIVEPISLTPAEVAAGTRVTYTVRFQNTGTYAAERVFISDTLSSDLQWNTLASLASSHANTWFIQNGVLHVVFEDINLPDSTSDEPGSHGFVTFNVVPSASLMLGESVGNTANIFFDYNEPVITNEAVFIVDEGMTVLENNQDAVRMWPNPVSDQLFATGASGAFEVMDAMGRVVLRGNASSLSRGLDVGHLPAGCYSLRLAAGPPGSFVKR